MQRRGMIGVVAEDSLVQSQCSGPLAGLVQALGGGEPLAEGQRNYHDCISGFHAGGNGSGGGSGCGGFKSFPGGLSRVLSSGIGVPHSGQRSLLARRS